MDAAPPPPVLDPRSITRPDPVLRTYYVLVSILSGPGVVVALPLLMFKYMTLRYRFDDEGIAMSWGVLFRQEIYLTYRRIQDIHVTRGIVQRWLGIATISVQTAAGSASAEMQIEGIVQYDALRDFLYRRMRGAHPDHAHHQVASDRAGRTPPSAPPTQPGYLGGSTVGPDAELDLATVGARTGAPQGGADEALALLVEIRDELRRLRAAREGGAR